MRYGSIALVLFALAAPAAAPAAAQQGGMAGHDMSAMGGMHDDMHAAKGSGKMPAGWRARLDDDAASLKDIHVMKMGSAMHIMTGPATILWRPADKLTGNFVVSGTFEQMKMPEHPEAYGVIFAATNLDKADQGYLYFLIRHDGRFLIKHRAGNDTHGIVDWSLSPAIVQPDAKGHSVNKLAVDAGGDKIRFLINGLQVAAFDRDKPMTAAGIAGIRVNHNLDVHVNNFRVVRK
jgi:hypothetical protein